jgi:hypothetical protein
LIDAAAVLDPADRALLNLLVNRGLDDNSLARLSRVSAAAIVARRERIVNRLSDQLGLPPDHVRGALDQLGAAAREPPAAANAAATPANGNGVPALAPARTARDASALAPAARLTASEGPESAAADVAPPDQAGQPEHRFKHKRLFSQAVAGACIAAVLVVVLTSTATKNARHVPVTSSTAAGAAPSTLTPTPPAPITTPAHTKPRADRRGAAGAYPQRLATLPGGTSKATGSVALAGTAARPRLILNLMGLITAQHGYYEAWLYNSILDSVPLVRLRDGVTRSSARLPRDYQRYLWIDISFQPPGLVNDSGESVMRARVPARGR